MIKAFFANILKTTSSRTNCIVQKNYCHTAKKIFSSTIKADGYVGVKFPLVKNFMKPENLL